MTEIEFNGDWTYNIEIPVFKGFQSRKGAYTSIDSTEKCNGEITVEFEDDLTENPDPYPEQFNALNFFIDNQEEIIANVINQIFEELPEIIVNYDLQQEPKYSELSLDKLRGLVGFSTLYIKIPSKDGISYIDLTGGCDWDEEHGLNILLHKNRVVKVSGIDGSSYWDAIKDNGTYDELKEKLRNKTIPKKYKAHPKYNKLKPSQISENETFEHNLISGGYNDIFIDLVKKGEIDINGKWESQDKTFLEAACWFNNNEIVEFLLNKGAEIRYAIHQCFGYNNNPEGFELLLKFGGNINQQDLVGNTILNIAAEKLSSLYDGLAQNIRYNWGNSESVLTDIEKQKEKIINLIRLGADLKIKNRYGFNCFDMSRNLSADQKIEMDSFLNKCLTIKSRIIKENKWKF